MVEVGVWKGQSVSHLAGWLKEHKQGVLLAVDTWLGKRSWMNHANAASNRAAMQEPQSFGQRGLKTSRVTWRFAMDIRKSTIPSFQM